MKRAIIYARVSTDDQADRGYSLPSQLDLCRKYAERLGFAIEAEFSEEYSGATAIAERPEGKKLAAMVKAHSADAVIAYQVDRLSRDIVDLLASVRNWLRSGIEVHACDIGRVESELDIVLVIKGWQGSDERKKIAERTTRGRIAKAKAGRVTGQGQPLYGYHFSTESDSTARRQKTIGFLIYEPEAKVVRLIYQWYVHGDESGKPLAVYAIARKLSEMGIPSPGERNGCYRVRQAGMWGELTLHRMLSNETYAGLWCYRKNTRKNGNGTEIPRPKNEQIGVQVPPIVDRTLWKAAQKQREFNKRMSARNTKYEYLLRGLVRCGCGGSFGGSLGSHPKLSHRYYRCHRRGGAFAGLEEMDCREKSIRAEVVEDVVWNYIVSAIKDAKDFESALRQAQQNEIKSLEPKSKELENLLGLIEQSKKEAAKLANALANVPLGIVSQTIQNQIVQLDEIYEKQMKRRAELEEALNGQGITEEAIESVLNFRMSVLEGLANPTFEDKRRMLELLNTEVVIANRQVVVRCYLPIEPGVIDLQASANLKVNNNFFALESKPFDLSLTKLYRQARNWSKALAA